MIPIIQNNHYIFHIVVIFLKGGRDLSKMHSVQLLNDYKIAVELDNGSSFVYDLKPKLQTARFTALVDRDFFQSGQLVDNDCIRWSDSLMLYAYEMLDGMKRSG